MKKTVLILVIVFALDANAQTYLINFEGLGASASVSSVKIENLTASTMLLLDGSKTLRLSGTTDINSFGNTRSSDLKIFPNPMTNNSIIQLYPAVSGNAIITIYDLTGKSLYKNQFYLDLNLQELRLSGIKQGSYLINVKGSGYQYSEILISSGRTSGPIYMEKVSNNTQTTDSKESVSETKSDPDIVDMAYTSGDLLRFTCISGIFSTVIMDVPTQDKTVAVDFVACTDGDNNSYPVVKIGSQVWMAENLRTTKTSGGTLIPAGVYDYNNIPENSLIYGKLYTWSAMMAGAASSNLSPSGVQGVCPSGWHLPSLTEMTALVTNLGGTSLAGGKLKESGTSIWNSPNTGASNSSGFSGLPGGFIGAALNFGNLGNNGYYWTSTEYFANNGYDMTLVYSAQSVTLNNTFKTFGFSCRCVKD